MVMKAEDWQAEDERSQESVCMGSTSGSDHDTAEDDLKRQKFVEQNENQFEAPSGFENLERVSPPRHVSPSGFNLNENSQYGNLSYHFWRNISAHLNSKWSSEVNTTIVSKASSSQIGLKDGMASSNTEFCSPGGGGRAPETSFAFDRIDQDALRTQSIGKRVAEYHDVASTYIAEIDESMKTYKKKWPRCTSASSTQVPRSRESNRNFSSTNSFQRITEVIQKLDETKRAVCDRLIKDIQHYSDDDVPCINEVTVESDDGLKKGSRSFNEVKTLDELYQSFDSDTLERDYEIERLLPPRVDPRNTSKQRTPFTEAVKILTKYGESLKRFQECGSRDSSTVSRSSSMDLGSGSDASLEDAGAEALAEDPLSLSHKQFITEDIPPRTIHINTRDPRKPPEPIKNIRIDSESLRRKKNDENHSYLLETSADDRSWPVRVAPYLFPEITGLVNLNCTTCFINAGLQLLTLDSKFCEDLRQRARHWEDNGKIPCDMPVTTALVDFVTQRREHNPHGEASDRSIDPVDVREIAFTKMGDKFKRRQQGDCEEFVTACLNGLKTELEISGEGPSNDPVSQHFGLELLTLKTLSNGQCLEEVSHDHLLRAPVSGEAVTYEDLLTQYTTQTRTSEGHRLQTLVGSAPRLLLVQLQAFRPAGDAGAVEKACVEVDLQPQLVLREEWVTNDLADCDLPGYFLVGVVFHIGKSMHSGHYTSAVLCSTAGGLHKWCYFNDEVITVYKQVNDIPSGPTHTPYLLMFRRGHFNGIKRLKNPETLRSSQEIPDPQTSSSRAPRSPNSVVGSEAQRNDDSENSASETRQVSLNSVRSREDVKEGKSTCGSQDDVGGNKLTHREDDQNVAECLETSPSDQPECEKSARTTCADQPECEEILRTFIDHPECDEVLRTTPVDQPEYEGNSRKTSFDQPECEGNSRTGFDQPEWEGSSRTTGFNQPECEGISRTTGFDQPECEGSSRKTGIDEPKREDSVETTSVVEVRAQTSENMTCDNDPEGREGMKEVCFNQTKETEILKTTFMGHTDKMKAEKATGGDQINDTEVLNDTIIYQEEEEVIVNQIKEIEVSKAPTVHREEMGVTERLTDHQVQEMELSKATTLDQMTEIGVLKDQENSMALPEATDVNANKISSPYTKTAELKVTECILEKDLPPVRDEKDVEDNCNVKRNENLGDLPVYSLTTKHSHAGSKPKNGFPAISLAFRGHTEGEGHQQGLTGGLFSTLIEKFEDGSRYFRDREHEDFLEAGDEEEATLCFNIGFPEEFDLSSEHCIVSPKSTGFPEEPNSLFQGSAGLGGASTSLPEESTSLPEESSGLLEGSSGLPEESTSLPEGSSGLPEESTGLPEESTSLPEDSTGLPEESTGWPEESTSLPEDYTGLYEGSTNLAEESTNDVENNSNKVSVKSDTDVIDDDDGGNEDVEGDDQQNESIKGKIEGADEADIASEIQEEGDAHERNGESDENEDDGDEENEDANDEDDENESDGDGDSEQGGDRDEDAGDDDKGGTGKGNENEKDDKNTDADDDDEENGNNGGNNGETDDNNKNEAQNSDEIDDAIMVTSDGEIDDNEGSNDDGSDSKDDGNTGTSDDGSDGYYDAQTRSSDDASNSDDERKDVALNRVRFMAGFQHTGAMYSYTITARIFKYFMEANSSQC